MLAILYNYLRLRSVLSPPLPIKKTETNQKSLRCGCARVVEIFIYLQGITKLNLISLNHRFKDMRHHLQVLRRYHSNLRDVSCIDLCAAYGAECNDVN